MRNCLVQAVLQIEGGHEAVTGRREVGCELKTAFEQNGRVFIAVARDRRFSQHLDGIHMIGVRVKEFEQYVLGNVRAAVAERGDCFLQVWLMHGHIEVVRIGCVRGKYVADKDVLFSQCGPSRRQIAIDIDRFDQHRDCRTILAQRPKCKPKLQTHFGPVGVRYGKRRENVPRCRILAFLSQGYPKQIFCFRVVRMVLQKFARARFRQPGRFLQEVLRFGKISVRRATVLGQPTCGVMKFGHDPVWSGRRVNN